MAKLGEHPFLEPAQQCCAFTIGQSFGFGQPVGIGCHCCLHPGPIADRRTNIAQRGAERIFQLSPRPGIAALGFEIDHRFALFARSIIIIIEDRGQPAVGIAPHRDHRVNEPADRKTLRGDRSGDRIDQERHVVINDRDPHEALSRRTRNRFQRKSRFAVNALPGSGKDEIGGSFKALIGKGNIARQQRISQPRCQ